MENKTPECVSGNCFGLGLVRPCELSEQLYHVHCSLGLSLPGEFPLKEIQFAHCETTLQSEPKRSGWG